MITVIELIDGSGVNIPPPSGGGGGGDPDPWYNLCRALPGTNPCGGGDPVGWTPVVSDDSFEPSDSLIAVRLKRAYEKCQQLSDSLFDKACQSDTEYTFTYVHTATDTIGRWPKPGDQNSSSPTLGMGTIGINHTHQDSGPNDAYKNQCFDGPDIYKLYYHIITNAGIGFSIITTRDYLYAAVITDPTKFRDYIRNLCGSFDINIIEQSLNNLHIDAMNNCSGTGCTWQKKSEMGVLAITANNNSQTSGIKIFKSPRQNINFTLLTP